MKNKIYLIIIIVLIAIFALTSISFILHADRLKKRINQNVNMMVKVESELARAREEKEGMSKANEKLQADSISYLSINSKLNNEKEAMEKRLKGAQKVIETKEANLQRVQQRLDGIEKRAVIENNARNEKLAKEKRALEKKILKSATAIKRERGAYHYNLGVAYAQAKLYDDAVVEYEKSLEFDPENGDAYYNLGILYEETEGDPERAIKSYKNYLSLNPAAEDFDEIQERINRLGG